MVLLYTLNIYNFGNISSVAMTLLAHCAMLKQPTLYTIVTNTAMTVIVLFLHGRKI